MSGYMYSKRKKEIRKSLGKGKRNGFWQLVKMTYKTIKGKKKTGYRVLWYGVVTEHMK
jgi:hypothetical protein